MCFPWYVVSNDISVAEDGESYQFKGFNGRCSFECIVFAPLQLGIFISVYSCTCTYILQFYIAFRFSHPNLNTQTVTQAKAPFALELPQTFHCVHYVRELPSFMFYVQFRFVLDTSLHKQCHAMIIYIQSLCSASIEPICVLHVYLPGSLSRQRCYFFFCK